MSQRNRNNQVGNNGKGYGELDRSDRRQLANNSYPESEWQTRHNRGDQAQGSGYSPGQQQYGQDRYGNDDRYEQRRNQTRRGFEPSMDTLGPSYEETLDEGGTYGNYSTRSGEHGGARSYEQDRYGQHEGRRNYQGGYPDEQNDPRYGSGRDRDFRSQGYADRAYTTGRQTRNEVDYNRGTSGYGSLGTTPNYRTGDNYAQRDMSEFNRNNYIDDGRYPASSLQRGKAPKGYTRSDQRIKEDISDRLMQTNEVDASDVEIAVQNGEVTLTGNVGSRHCKYCVEQIAESILGVTDVINQVRISRQQADTNYESKGTTKSSSTSGYDSASRSSGSQQNSLNSTSTTKKNSGTESSSSGYATTR